jgi:Putative transposase
VTPKEDRKIKRPFPPTTAPPRAGVGSHPPRCTPWRAPCQGGPEAPRASGGPALGAAGRPAPPGQGLGTERRRGWGYAAGGSDTNTMRAVEERPLVDAAPELARTMAASVQQRIAFGERAGERVRRISAGFGTEGEVPTLTGPRCASVQGFSLHANTQVPAHRRDQLERLLRYTARGAVSLERLEQDANGDLVYTFTHPWSDGTTGIRLSSMELLEKLAALVPLPRVHLVRYGGCLAPHSHLRGAIIPTPRQQGVDKEATDTGSLCWRWARLLKRVFALDLVRCPWCQEGTLRIIAAITQGEVIRTILRHLKLAVDPPAMAPARVHQEALAWSSA